jgi:hypothetical protein
VHLPPFLTHRTAAQALYGGAMPVSFLPSASDHETHPDDSYAMYVVLYTKTGDGYLRLQGDEAWPRQQLFHGGDRCPARNSRTHRHPNFD